MKRARFSIAALMGIIAFCGIVLNAWRMASPLTTNIVYNLTVAVLLVAVYKARYSTGLDGAWWLGFATFGWAQIVLNVRSLAMFQQNDMVLELVTSKILGISIAYWSKLIPGVFDAGTNFRYAALFFERYRILQILASLFVGFVGGWAFRFFAARRMDDNLPASQGEAHDRG